MRKTILFIVGLAFLLQFNAHSQEIAQWRGNNRDGIYHETGLLKQWPDVGPTLLWHYDDLGPGHASAAVTNEMVYTAGTSPDGIGFVVAFDHSGNLIWKTDFGPEWMESFEGTRSTPLVYDGKLYIMSSFGKLVCMTANSGEIQWTVDLFNDYDGRNIKWGVTENLLIDEGKLYVTPGGIEANVIALNKDSGELIWKSKGLEELSAYCSPIIIEVNGRKILVTQTANSILGLEASTGKLLWSFEHPNTWSVQANSPVFKDRKLYCFSGYGKGGVMLQVSGDGNSITELWRNSSLDSKMGGVVLVDGRIYGSGDKNKSWFCLDWETGEELYSSKMLKVGNIIYADGLLYCYGTGGKVGIVDPKTNDFNLISSFEVPYGEQYHWAHLVIHDKKLYVRHGTSLMVYDIAQK
ncbi:MAG: PQQ-binding-like beta-propeller repeat protein [Bacteroidetes bacterium]|nr:PQQ-binding-like beta-propeller repeat protein [Bacteroidota bacterium]